MADRRAEKEEKADEKNAEDFQPPQFDEEAFVHREMVSFRTTVILFVWGIVAAALSWAAYMGMDGARNSWYVGLLICAVMGYALKWLFPRLKADISHFKRKEWTGVGFLFFFTWLSFFLVAVNPPFGDHSPPQVEMQVTPSAAQPGDDVVVTVLAADNVGVSQEVEVVVTRDGVDVPVTVQGAGRGRFNASLGDLEEGRYTVVALAMDGTGRTGQATYNFTVAPHLEVFLPEGNALRGPQSQVVVQSDLERCARALSEAACITAIVLRNEGRTVVLEHSSSLDGWFASINHAGWVRGNNTFTVEAQLQDGFVGAGRVPGGALTVGPFTVDVQQTPGSRVPDEASGGPVRQPAAPVRATPGLEIVAVAGILLAVAIMRRRAN